MDIRRLTPEDDRSSFTCGDPALDDHFRVRAGQQQFRHRAGVTYVAVDRPAIVGFVTVVPGTVRRDELGASRLPRSALPVLLLARMGVSVSRQRAGVGAGLLATVLRLAVRMATDVGCVGVLVDAKPGAWRFYETHDFVRLPTDDGMTVRGFLPIGTIEVALAAAETR